MGSTTKITVERLQAGQPRPYADSIYETRVTVENDWLGDEMRPASEVAAERVARQLCTSDTWANKDGSRHWRTFPEKADAEWFEQHVTEVRHEKPGVVVVTTVQPYCD